MPSSDHSAPPSSAIGTLVITTTPVVDLDGQPRTGRVMGLAGDDLDRVWLDLCILGSHLPQMYRPSEFEPATRELAEKHDLCPTCLGYGVERIELFEAGREEPVEVTGGSTCDDCRGSGSSKFFVDITQNADGSVIEGRVTPREVTP